MAPKGKSGRALDKAWEHCVRVVPGQDNQVKCKYCPTIMYGGINRLKHHLARVVCKDVIVCDGCPEEVTAEMNAALESIKDQNAKRSRLRFETAGMGRSPMGPPGSCSSSFAPGAAGSPSITSHFILPRTTPGSQPTLDSFNERKRKEADMAVRRFWYHDSLSFNIARSPFYQPMVDAIASAGPGYKAPSYSALRGKDLDEELQCVKEQLESIKSSWEFTGCTILSDGWTDQRNRTIINFLVACPKGTMFLKSVDASSHVKDANLIFSLLAEVVEEVGAKNVVQVITDNAANYVAAGKLLCAKYPSLFWTPCAAHCIDLILEDIGKLEWVQDVVHECKQITKYIYNHAWVLSLMREHTEGELSRPAVTRFATNFLSLQSLLNEYQALRRMVSSREWIHYKDSTKPDAMAMSLSVRRDSLWEEVTEIVSMTEPLVRVLRIMDGDKPPMGYVYEGMDRAKEAIKVFYKGDESKYRPIWDIIDSRWDRQLHSPLHAAGAYLNPSIFYNAGSKIQKDPEVMRGMMICIERMYPNQETQDLINMQRDMYKDSYGMFGFSSTQRLREKKMPSQWWVDCGAETPQLQEFAIRILSQPCSASGCERNWSVFEHIHTKKRNRLEHERLEKLVYIYYNLRMLTKQLRGKDLDPILLDQIDLVSDWVVEDEAPPDLAWLDEETEGPSGVPFSEMETPNTPASQLIFPSSDVVTSSSRAYTRRSTARSHA